MSTPQERFTDLWHEQAPHVLAFPRRHVGTEAANDVVAETFLVAWRRWNDVTDPPIAWLLVAARKVIQNRARSTRRHRALEERVALLDGVAAYASDSADTAITPAARRSKGSPDSTRSTGKPCSSSAGTDSVTTKRQRSWASSPRRSVDGSAVPGRPFPKGRHRPAHNLARCHSRSCHEHRRTPPS